MWTFVFALLGLSVAMMAAVWLMRSPVPPVPPSGVETSLAPATVSRTNLLLVAGRLCLPGQTNAFTGIMIEHAAGGSLLSRSSISNGLLHGTSEGWHTNGRLQVTEHFNEGLSHGLRTKWHPTGAKLSEGRIVAAKFHGTFRRWTETGSLAEQIEFADGEPHGLSLAYYPSGFLKTRIRMDQGKVLENSSWPDGEKMAPIAASAVSNLARDSGQASR